MERNEDRLCWIDLETTGLDAETCNVLEVACVVTDNKLNEINYLSWVLNFNLTYEMCKSESVSPFVVSMHTKNNLWEECKISKWSLFDVDTRLAEFIWDQAPGAPLCGSTISFDRSFMKVHLPRALEKLHYRNIDVSSFKELARRSGVEFPETPKEDIAHRALADVRASIQILKGLNPWG